jgi:hypothetical protein
MEIYGDGTIMLHVEEVPQNLDEKDFQANFGYFHVPNVEPPYLPLPCTKFTHGQHELTMLIVLRAII